jgi:hypothetical protein
MKCWDQVVSEVKTRACCADRAGASRTARFRVTLDPSHSTFDSDAASWSQLLGDCIEDPRIAAVAVDFWKSSGSSTTRVSDFFAKLWGHAAGGPNGEKNAPDDAWKATRDQKLRGGDADIAAQILDYSSQTFRGYFKCSNVPAAFCGGSIAAARSLAEPYEPPSLSATESTSAHAAGTQDHSAAFARDFFAKYMLGWNASVGKPLQEWARLAYLAKAFFPQENGAPGAIDVLYDLTHRVRNVEVQQSQMGCTVSFVRVFSSAMALLSQRTAARGQERRGDATVAISKLDPDEQEPMRRICLPDGVGSDIVEVARLQHALDAVAGKGSSKTARGVASGREIYDDVLMPLDDDYGESHDDSDFTFDSR